MKKPNGYDEVTVQGEFTPVELGGHYAIVKQVTEQTSSTGKEMIVVLFDFADNDKQSGYFMTMFDNDSREDRKWAFNGTKYIMVMDYQNPDKTSKAFKTFCSCVERSNNYEIVWGGKNWNKQFAGKRIGVVFGEEENEYDGTIRMRRVPKWFCSWDKVESAGIPQPKLIGGTRITQPATSNDGFMTLPEGTEDEIPF